MASLVPELDDVRGRQCSQRICLEVSLLRGLHLVEFGFGIWRRLGSSFGSGDERTLKASRKLNMSFKLLCNFTFISFLFCNRAGVMY
jgi:hypothetical protein